MTDFKEQAQLTLDEIFNLVETEYDNFEVDFEEENIKIESLRDKSVFIISMHSPTSQIWLSSPRSGAHHFEKSLSNSSTWVSTRDPNLELFNLLKSELSE